MNNLAFEHADAASGNAQAAVNAAEHGSAEAAAYGLAGIANALAAISFEFSRHNDLLAKIHGINEAE